MTTEFGRSTKLLRLRFDESIKDMARHLGCGMSTLSSYETGRASVPDQIYAKLELLYGWNGKPLEGMISENKAWRDLRNNGETT